MKIYIYKYEYFDSIEQRFKIEYEIFNKNYLFNKSICECEGDNKEINNNNQTISMSEFKNLISKNISSFINP